MDSKKNLKIRIEKISNPLDVQYNVYVQGREDIGFVIVKPLFVRERIDREELLKWGLGKEDKTGYIHRFYPNGFPGENKDMHKGVGSYTLEFIIRDLRKKGIKMIDLVTKEKSMKNFCLKNNFVGEIPIFGNFSGFYKII